MDKTDLILQEIKNLGNQITQIDTDNKKEHKKIFENLDRIDNRITRSNADNEEEHEKIRTLLDSINSTFLKFEAETSDKVRILFDANTNCQNHQNIYAHEFSKLNNLVTKHSFQISNLESQLKEI